MTRTRFLVLLVLGLSTMAHEAEAGRPLRLVALNLKPINGFTAEQAELLSRAVVEKVYERKKFEVKSQSDIEPILGKARLDQLVGCADDNCRTPFAIDLQAEFILYGTIGRLQEGGAYHLSLSLYHVPTRIVERRANEQATPDDPELNAAVQIAVCVLLGEEDCAPGTGRNLPWLPIAMILSGGAVSGVQLAGGLERETQPQADVANALFWAGTAVVTGGIGWLIAELGD